MSQIATVVWKLFRWASEVFIPRRIGGGISLPPWSGQAAAFAMVISLAGYSCLRALPGSVLFPALVFSIPMFCCLVYLTRTSSTTVGKVFGLTGNRFGQVLISGLVLFVVESLWIGVGCNLVDKLGFEFWPEEEGNAVSVSLFVDMTLWAPICEELTFRGLVYTSLRTRLGVAPACVFTALAFALFHAPCSANKIE